MSRTQNGGGQVLFGEPIRPIRYYDLYGNWTAGVALSVYQIHDPRFPQVRSPLGKLLYKLKYEKDISVLDKIAQTVALAVKRLKVYPELDAIVPVPPSKLNREFQPVIELAKRVSEYTGIPLELNYLVKIKKTPEMKRFKNQSRKLKLLRDSYAVIGNGLEGKTVLLFDDIYDTGATLTACTEKLLSEGKVRRVYVLTVAKTWPCPNYEPTKVHCGKCWLSMKRFKSTQDGNQDL
ncbi:ComF family protein [Fervidobacterium thailandense]|uniref:ComF family protein n=1 Tax=Fervidobacterium thailandense TaxID=1008305 RepID=A0A1E3G2V2_9BACT|nr:ComF family protein [Fervidobacterium thailandense]ODN30193.1 hypothetical protein A4H02_06420 [Fervidobacterium thailandense]